jgi:hypothetical protein
MGFNLQFTILGVNFVAQSEIIASIFNYIIRIYSSVLRQSKKGPYYSKSFFPFSGKWLFPAFCLSIGKWLVEPLLVAYSIIYKNRTPLGVICPKLGAHSHRRCQNSKQWCTQNKNLISQTRISQFLTTRNDGCARFFVWAR